MNIHYVGIPDGKLEIPSEYQLVEYSGKVPPFVVDALLVFTEGDPDESAVGLLRRSGRPVLDLNLAPAAAPRKTAYLQDWLAGVKSLPRTNYKPIDCNFYDNFEAAIVQRHAVALEYLGQADDTLVVTTHLKDLKTERTEEYVQLIDGQWIRLDRIISVDGNQAGASCRF